MSVSSEITRITNARNTLRTKAVSLGIGLSTDDLSSLATKYNNIADKGTPSAQVMEGETYTIAPGYYRGGTVQGVGGGGNYTLQAKIVTPTKSSQSITADSGYYGLSSVTVNAIPDAYQDVTDVTATASDVLQGKVIVMSNGSEVAGTMPNNGAVTQTLNAGSSYTIPAGYHSGAGKVTANSLASQTGVDDGKTAIIPAMVVIGYQGWVNGAKVSGNMPNNGDVTSTITGLGSVEGDTEVVIPAGYTSGGTISLSSDIESALAAI